MGDFTIQGVSRAASGQLSPLLDRVAIKQSNTPQTQQVTVVQSAKAVAAATSTLQNDQSRSVSQKKRSEASFSQPDSNSGRNQAQSSEAKSGTDKRLNTVA